MGGVGVKSISSDMNLSSSLLYKWCQPKDHPDAPGADNPLDRLQKIIELTGDDGPVKWLCEQSNGYFTRNPALVVKSDIPLINVTRGILKEFSTLLDTVSESIENDGEILEDEAEEIRAAWETLKSSTESFVVACEKGQYIKK
jgi:hypothetical protein